MKDTNPGKARDPIRRHAAASSATWSAGMSIGDITPPIGSHMFGFGARDRDHGCEGIHDPLQIRAVHITAAGESVLLLSFDVLFFDRAEVDRIKDAVGRVLNLAPRQILINCTHTHLGPVTGTWSFANYQPLKNATYLDNIVAASVRAACEAQAAARPARLRFGKTRSDVPVSRRYLNAAGKAEWRPAPAVPVYDTLPVLCLEEATSGAPIAILFAVACHPSTASGFQISADYPGVARALIDRHVGRPVAFFLQGVGGDTKPCSVADGPADDTGLVTWRSGNWEDIRRAGSLVADAVLKILPNLELVDNPMIRSAITEAMLPFAKIPSRDVLKEIEAKAEVDDLRRLWAAHQLELLAASGRLSSVAPIRIQSIRLAERLQFVALEGEPVAAWGWEIENAFHGSDTVIPLGYSNGQGLYLPVEAMLTQGGYEVESVYEYGFSGDQLAPGFSTSIFSAMGAGCPRNA